VVIVVFIWNSIPAFSAFQCRASLRQKPLLGAKDVMALGILAVDADTDA
jgi:hypothetical protein